MALLNASSQTGLANPLDEAILAAGVPPDGYAKTDATPNDFTRKRLSVVVEKDGARQLITTGALENVLGLCVTVGDQYVAWSAKGMRELGVATRALAAGEKPEERDLTFARFLLLFDPPKPGVRETLVNLGKLGVTVKLTTGENHVVAAEVGLDATGILTSSQLREMSDEALWHKAERTSL
jgi:Mg2+-importing ATPase